MSGAETAALLARAVAPILPAWRSAEWPARADTINAWVAQHNATTPGKPDKARVFLQALLDALGKPDLSCLEAVMLYQAGCDRDHRNAAAAEIPKYSEDAVIDFLSDHQALRLLVVDKP